MALHIQSHIIRPPASITCKIYKTSYRNLPYVSIVGCSHLQHTHTRAHFNGWQSTQTRLRDIDYALVAGAPEAYGSHRVCLSVRLYFQVTFLHNSWILNTETCFASKTQFSWKKILNRFRFKALLSTLAWCTHLSGGCQQSSVQRRTNLSQQAA